MNNLVRLELIAQSYDRFFRTRDIEHLKDVERILEYDGLVQVDDSNNAEMLQVPALIEQETTLETARIQRGIDFEEYWRENKNAHK